MSRKMLGIVGLGCLAVLGVARAGQAQTPTVVSAYAKTFMVTSLLTKFPGHPTQFAWGPKGRLYVITQEAGVHSYAYNKTTGALSDHKVSVPDISGLGIAFYNYNKTWTMFLSAFGPNHTDGLYKLTDDNQNDIWGEAKEKKIPIVTGIPEGDHDIDNIQIIGNSLYVGVGRRTINGHKGVLTSGSLDDYGGSGFWSGGQGKTWGDSAYNGTICTIPDLRLVEDMPNSANAWTDTKLTQTLIQDDESPFTVTGKGKLIVHSAGSRNPFGLAVDKNNNLWFTVNFNRTKTNGDGTAGFGYPKDVLGPDFSKDVHDQLFMASAKADYGYTDDNWRPKNPMMDKTKKGYLRVLSTTYDNLFNKGPYPQYNPANPVGLGPSSSSDGCTFFYAPALPTELVNNIWICRYNHTITEAAPGTHSLTYADVVAVDTDPKSKQYGKVRRIVYNFNQPLAIISDGGNHMIVGDYGSQSLYLITKK